MATKGPGEWNPWELFKESPEELDRIKRRGVLRSEIRADWVKKRSNPYYSSTGYIFDPTAQRFQSAKMTRYDHFKVNKFSIAFGFFSVVVPISIICIAVHWERSWYFKKVNTGEHTPRDRFAKFIF